MNFRDSHLKRSLKNLLISSNTDVVVIEPHLGLGDNLICLALVRQLSSQYPQKQFYYACLARCYHSLAWMFFDLNNVYLFVVKSGR
jgi:ADP-heptose:LPS heptosyltransferase